MIFLVYLADIVSGLSTLLAIGGLVSLIAALGTAAVLAVDFKKKVGYLWWAVPLCMLAMVIGALLPSKQGVYQIMAAYGVVETVQYIQQSDDAKRIAGKSIQAVEKVLDDAIKEEKK